MQSVVEIFNSIYSSMGLGLVASSGDVWGFLASFTMLLFSFRNFLSKAPAQIEYKESKTSTPDVAVEETPAPLAKAELPETEVPSKEREPEQDAEATEEPVAKVEKVEVVEKKILHT